MILVKGQKRDAPCPSLVSRPLLSTSILSQFWSSGSAQFRSDEESNDLWVGGQCSGSLNRLSMAKLGFSWMI
jgi:hypothetical protein